jgi:Flp pilus assembly protein TadG
MNWLRRIAPKWIAHTARRGSHVVEFVIIAPVVFLIIGVMIAGGHVYFAHQKVEHAAAAAARAASITRPVFAVNSTAEAAARTDMVATGLTCMSQSIVVDTSQYMFPPGVPAVVTATVTCEMELGMLGVFGISGHRTITSTVRSSIDTYRERAR